METALLDDKPMIVMRGAQWCCMLCKRQFETEDKLQKHVAKSSLHSDNLAEARRAGRIRDSSATSAKRPAPSTESSSQPAVNRPAAPASSLLSGGSSIAAM